MDIIDVALWGTFLLMVIAAGAAIVLPIINSLSEPKTLVKAGVGVLAIVVLFVIGYAIAGDEITDKYTAVNFTSPNASKMVGGVLFTMFAMMTIAFVGILFTEVNKMLK